MQTWRPEFISPKPKEVLVSLEENDSLPGISDLRTWSWVIPLAKWLGRLAEPLSNGFCDRSYLNKWNEIQLKKTATSTSGIQFICGHAPSYNHDWHKAGAYYLNVADCLWCKSLSITVEVSLLVQLQFILIFSLLPNTFSLNLSLHNIYLPVMFFSLQTKKLYFNHWFSTSD